MSALDTSDEQATARPVRTTADIEVHLAGVVFGPFSEEKIRQRLSEGLLVGTDAARFAESEEWLPLVDLLAQVPPAPAPPAARAAATLPKGPSAAGTTSIAPPRSVPITPGNTPLPAAVTRSSLPGQLGSEPGTVPSRRTSRISLPPAAEPSAAAPASARPPEQKLRFPQGPLHRAGTSDLPAIGGTAAATSRPATAPLPPPPRRTSSLPKPAVISRSLPVIPPLPASSNRTAPLGGIRSKILARTAGDPLKGPSAPEPVRRAAPPMTNRQTTLPLTRPMPSATAVLIPSAQPAAAKAPEPPPPALEIPEPAEPIPVEAPPAEEEAVAPKLEEAAPAETPAPETSEALETEQPEPPPAEPEPAAPLHAIPAAIKVQEPHAAPIRAQSAPSTAGAAIHAPSRSTRLIPASAIASGTMPPLNPQAPPRPAEKRPARTSVLSVVLPPRKSQALMTPPPRPEKMPAARAVPAASVPAPAEALPTPEAFPSKAPAVPRGPIGPSSTSGFAPLPKSKGGPAPAEPASSGLKAAPRPPVHGAAITLGAPLSARATPGPRSSSTPTTPLGPGPTTPTILSSVAAPPAQAKALSPAGAPVPKTPPSSLRSSTTTLLSPVLKSASLLPRTGPLAGFEPRPAKVAPVTLNPPPASGVPAEEALPPAAEPEPETEEEAARRVAVEDIRRKRQMNLILAIAGAVALLFLLGFFVYAALRLAHHKPMKPAKSEAPSSPSALAAPPPPPPSNPSNAMTAAPASTPAAPTAPDPRVAMLIASAKDKQSHGDLDGAIADFTSAVTLDPQSTQAFVGRAAARQGKGDLDGAVADDNQVLALDPNNSDALAQRAFIKQTRNDLDGAVADYTRALGIDPKAFIAYYNRGLIKEQKNDLDGAIADYNQALDLNPRLAGAYYNRGNVKSKKSDFDGAIADYTRALDLNPKMAMAACYRGLAEQTNGNFDAAFYDYNQALTLDPNIAIAYYNRGLIKEQRNDLDGAISDSTKALDLDPRNVQAYYNRGVAQQAMGNLDTAAADLTKFAELSPKSPYADYARLYLWVIAAQQNHKATADQDLANAVQNSWNAEPGALPSKIAAFLLDHISESDLMAAAASSDAKKDQGQHCEAWYFDGMKKLLTGDKLAGLDCLHRCLNTGQKDYCEYILAQAELQALGQD